MHKYQETDGNMARICISMSNKLQKSQPAWKEMKIASFVGFIVGVLAMIPERRGIT